MLVVNKGWVIHVHTPASAQLIASNSHSAHPLQAVLLHLAGSQGSYLLDVYFTPKVEMEWKPDGKSLKKNWLPDLTLIRIIEAEEEVCALHRAELQRNLPRKGARGFQYHCRTGVNFLQKISSPEKRKKEYPSLANFGRLGNWRTFQNFWKPLFIPKIVYPGKCGTLLGFKEGFQMAQVVVSSQSVA